MCESRRIASSDFEYSIGPLFSNRFHPFLSPSSIDLTKNGTQVMEQRVKCYFHNVNVLLGG